MWWMTDCLSICRRGLPRPLLPRRGQRVRDRAGVTVMLVTLHAAIAKIRNESKADVTKAVFDNEGSFDARTPRT